MGHDDATQRTSQITGSKDAEGLQLAQPLWHVGRKEELANHHGKEDVDDEIIKLEGTAQSGQGQGTQILTVKRTSRVA